TPGVGRRWREVDRAARGVEGPYRGEEMPLSMRGLSALARRAGGTRRQPRNRLHLGAFALRTVARRGLRCLGRCAAFERWLTLEHSLQIVAVQCLVLDQRRGDAIEHVTVISDDRDGLGVPLVDQRADL